MGTFTSFKKAYGALKDTTKVGLAKVNSEFKELDIAIVKATNHIESPPKERHVRKIFSATSVIRPRADVAYCIHALSKRLSKTRSWIVAIKTMIVIHRTLREGDPTFREELLHFSHRGNILQISNFKDDSSAIAWDCSAWVRTYALFLEERLECFRILKYDIEAEHLTKSMPGTTKVHSRTRLLNRDELLEQLPALQQLLYRLVGCRPEGGAYYNYLVQYALALVLKESFKIYCAVNDGIINLVDMFFDMSRHDALKALNIYKRAGQQAEHLAEFYEYCKGLDLARNFQFPILRQPPPSFLATMEEYIKEAPQSGFVPKRLEYQELEDKELMKKLEEPLEPTPKETKDEENEKSLETDEETHPKDEEIEEPPLLISTDETDLLGLNEVNPKAAELEESNALALAIVQPGTKPPPSSRALTEFGGAGWELALVTTPSTNNNHVEESKLAGGFDRLLLDSLYEDDAARRRLQLQNAGYVYGPSPTQNPFEQQDPFAMSNRIAPPSNVQMAMMMTQQQNMVMMQQQQHPMMTMPFQYHQYHQPRTQQQIGSPNPFDDTFSIVPRNPTPPSYQGSHTFI